MGIKKVSLDSLLLDPNNYRIRGKEHYSIVDWENYGNVMVQKRIMKMIKEENGIKELLESFKENGYLPIDNIIVQPYPKKQGKYVVIEGNRRVTTLKTLKELYEDGMEIGNVDPNVFKKVEVIVYEGEQKDYEILMGLRHVSGVKEWGDYEQSELISNLAQKHHMNAKQISESLGIGTVVVKRRLNTYYAMQIFKNDPDYEDYFVPEKLSAIFYEIMGKPEIRDTWLNWNKDLNTFENKENMRRLFSWLIPSEDEDGESSGPIITRREDIRTLAKFIMDEEALNKLEETKSVEEAKEESEFYSKEGFKKNLKNIVKNLNRLSLGALTELEPADKKLIAKMLDKMEEQRKIISNIVQL